MKPLRYLLLLLTLAVLRPAAAQEAPPKYEFRGAWVATVVRLDWPDSSAPQLQRDQLVRMFDRLEAAGINAVLFQVRAEADALYASSYEPWSYWLTGEQGKAPEPFYDPLAFAIEEAHRRGMELHAWFNPYRAVRGSGYANDSTHVSVTRPEWMLKFGNLQILNPGIPAVREYVTNVILDVVNRYDVDGVHFDDYFYPYEGIQNEDAETFRTYNTLGFRDIRTWRTYNVNMLVKGVYEAINAADSSVVFGISPFGIWRSGVPPGITGLSAVDVLYADAVNWLQQQWVDYLTPQLYWPFGGGQDYGKLAPWWAQQTNGRHLYPGHGLYRSDFATFSGSLFGAGEIPRQVRFNRSQPGIQGSVFFRAKNITDYGSKGFADSLRADLYRHPSLPPIMPWQNMTPPPAPEALTHETTATGEVRLRWNRPDTAGVDAPPRFYAVYRTAASVPPDLPAVLADARNLVEVTGATTFTDRPGAAEGSYYYYVTAVSANSVESAPAGPAVVATPVPTEREAPFTFALNPNYPDPFNPTTTVEFTLEAAAPVQARVYNLLGQVVATLAGGEPFGPGTHRLQWDGRDAGGRLLSSGTYLLVLEADGRRATETMTLIK